jgi:hypothetical protein|uniref:Uncharacterized protein n=1 Tax=Siphoviridae sp. ctqPo10 TaxID=2827948 RepID=A0A8S5SUS0_9CAUD|nr:MAG TPA: hypothetical protein [Siphoviridae sp. ctqPo10]DAS43379.1 MAG TPA: hypothetical protein [Caudoviricetes sp.]DAT99378.1 MAG TPA: hypothetical protein [Caudoviricetes sp.]
MNLSVNVMKTNADVESNFDMEIIYQEVREVE